MNEILPERVPNLSAGSRRASFRRWRISFGKSLEWVRMILNLSAKNVPNGTDN
jgi:hypothetical protein